MSLKDKWEESYSRGENFLFYPSEELVRFVSKFIMKIDHSDSVPQSSASSLRCLDVGSGAGRHLFYLWQNGFYPIGLEWSGEACRAARRFMDLKRVPENAYDIMNSSSTRVDLPDSSVDFAISISTLDSMPSGDSRLSVTEIYRVLKPNGWFYGDVISTDTVRLGQFKSFGDQIVADEHEYGTIQSYFDLDRILSLLTNFEKVELFKNVRFDTEGNCLTSRWHFVFRKAS